MVKFLSQALINHPILTLIGCLLFGAALVGILRVDADAKYRQQLVIGRNIAVGLVVVLLPIMFLNSASNTLYQTHVQTVPATYLHQSTPVNHQQTYLFRQGNHYLYLSSADLDSSTELKLQSAQNVAVNLVLVSAHRDQHLAHPNWVGPAVEPVGVKTIEFDANHKAQTKMIPLPTITWQALVK